MNRGQSDHHRALLAAIWGGEYTEQTEYQGLCRPAKKKIEDPGRPRYLLTEPWVATAS